MSRSLLVLIIGTGIGQAIPVIISPLLTRLYSPDNFGGLALYISILSMLSVLATGRYELAVALPKHDRDAIHVVCISLGLCLAVCVTMVIMITFIHSKIIVLGSLSKISTWIYVLPLSTFLIGSYNSLNCWANRKGLYSSLALGRVSQSAFGGIFQLLAAGKTSGGSGLLIGQIIGQSISTGLLGRLFFTNQQKRLKSLSWCRLLALARKYSNFPKIMVLAHSLNAASSQMVIFLFNSMYDSATLGYFTLVQRVLGAPMLLVANSIGDIFRKEAAETYIKSGNCSDIYLRTSRNLVVVSIVPFTIIFLFSPDLFKIVFGPKWTTAGDYARIVTPMFFFQFITSPLSSMFVIGQKQKLDLLWQVALVITVSFAILIGNRVSGIRVSLILLSATYSAMYAANWYIAYRISKGDFLRNK